MAAFKNHPAEVVENGRRVGARVPFYEGPAKTFFCYQPNPFTFVPETSDYFGLANYQEIAVVLAQYSQVIIPREVLFNQGSTWTDFSTDESDVDYTWNAAYGPRWKLLIAAVRAMQTARPLSQRTRFYAYVPLGHRSGTDYSLTQAQLAKAAVEAISASRLGADGIFGDEAGYDYQAHRVTHTNYLVTQARAQAVARTNKGCVMLNAWFPLQVMGTGSAGFDATYNPSSVAPSFGGTQQRGGGDTFMMESCPVNTSTSTSQYVTNYHIQNFRFTDASNGVQGMNERVQNAQIGRAARNVTLCALNFIELSPNNEFYDRLAQAVCVMWSVEYLAISRNEQFQDFQPRPWTMLPWREMLGSFKFYDPKPVVTTITNGGGSTKSGWIRQFEHGALGLWLNPTLGLHGIFGPGFSWHPGMSPSQESGGSHQLRPCDTVIDDGDADLTDNPDTSNGYPIGVIPELQAGHDLVIGDRALSLSAGNAGPWFAYNNVAGACFMRRSGDFYPGMGSLNGARVRIRGGMLEGTSYEVTTQNPFIVGVDTVTFDFENGNIVFTETITIPIGQGSIGKEVYSDFEVPEGCLVAGASWRVIQAPGGGATNMDLGIDGLDSDCFADAADVTVGTSNSILDGHAGLEWPMENQVAAPVVVTPDSDVTDADMIIRIRVSVCTFPPPLAV
jgi:hypothetical protein